MSDSWLDHLPTNERTKLRKRMRSAAEYEKLRENVKGPEDLEKEMNRNEGLAELRFAMETQLEVKNALKKQMEKDMREQGIESVIESERLSPEQRKSLETGKFAVAVSMHPSTHQDHLVVISEGNVQEHIPLKASFNDRYVAQFAQSATPLGKLGSAKKKCAS
jgi:hypothetical protein